MHQKSMTAKTLEQIHDLFQATSTSRSPSSKQDEIERLSFVRSFDDVSFVVDKSNKIGWVFFHRHNKSVNTLDQQVITKADKLLDEIETFESQEKILSLVLFSLKPNNFIAGADVNMLLTIETPEQGKKLSLEGHRLLDRFERLRIPTLSAIHGSCLGGGLEVALATSHRLATDHRSTQLGLPEVKLGLLPGCGGTARLPRLIGLSAALEMILQGSSVTANKALSLGLVDSVIPFESEASLFKKVHDYAMELKICKTQPKYSRRGRSIKELMLEKNFLGRWAIDYITKNNLDKLTKGHYPAPYVALETVLKGYKMKFKYACLLEAESFGRLSCTREAKNLINLFLMMEDTKKLEHVCEPSKIKEINKIGVIGAGIMGAGISQLAALKNHHVYMRDIDLNFIQNGMKKVNALFDKLVQHKKISVQEKDEIMAHVSAGTTNDQLRDAQLVIEAVVEQLDVKQKVLAELEDINPDAVFATNTSSIPIGQIAEKAKFKDRVVGMHFFHPVHKMPLCEIIKTSDTSNIALGTVYKLALAMGKIPIVVRDGPGFLTTRLFAVYVMEAARIGLEGQFPIERIDQLIVDFGMPMGPFRVIDNSGLDIGVHVIPTLAKHLGIEFEQFHALKELVATGALGEKTGRGFYLYENGKATSLNPDVSRVFERFRSINPPSSTESDVVDRCLLSLANEATKCLMEGIAQSPEDIDLAMILGFGFAPFRGGLLKYVDDRGLKQVVARLEQMAKQFGSRFKPTTLLKNMAETDQKFFPDRVFHKPVVISPHNNSKL